MVSQFCVPSARLGTRLAELETMKNNELSRIEKLLELYYPSLFRFAERLCGSPAVAMALTQCTFREAFDHSRTLPVPRNNRAWLFAILFHRFLEDRFLEIPLADQVS
jgi:DNA-directed RNA polymerase specialized sigma24 family protein